MVQQDLRFNCSSSVNLLREDETCEVVYFLMADE